MEKESVPHEQALALKELGFDEPCICRYCIVTEWEKPTGVILLQQIDCKISDKTFIKAPLYQQAFRFFREKYCLNSFIVDSKSYAWYFNINDMQTDDVISEVLYFKKYEEAELACLVKLIEIVKENKI